MTSAITSSQMVDQTTVSAATAVVRAARDRGADVRLLGGIGVALRCQSAQADGPLVRSYSDIDLVTTREATQALSRVVEDLRFAPEPRFNSLHGRSRMMFDSSDGIHLDVFVDRFVMCHSLDLRSRLGLHSMTVSLADLLLTKLQVAELNAKDVTDAAALLLDHDLTRDEKGINVEYVTTVLCRDWGWWRTVSDNLDVLPSHVRDRLPAAAAAQVSARARELLSALEAAPKSLRWKARAKAGDRLAWRDEPEESH